MSELKRITYAEDEPDIRAVAQIALEDIGGFTLDICSSGLEALKKAPEFDPDLFLLDVMMPGMDGIETLQILKKMPAMADTPVVFMTAKTQAAEIEGYLKLGAEEVIPKPFDATTLARDLQSVWDRIQAEKAG